MALASIPELIDEIRAGRMVVLMDDEDRENEGDLIIAAQCITPEIINFSKTYFILLKLVSHRSCLSI